MTWSLDELATGMNNIIRKNFHLLNSEMLWQTAEMAFDAPASTFICHSLTLGWTTSERKIFKTNFEAPHLGYPPPMSKALELKNNIISTTWNVLRSRFVRETKFSNLILPSTQAASTWSLSMPVHEQHIECDRMDFNLIPFDWNTTKNIFERANPANMNKIYAQPEWWWCCCCGVYYLFYSNSKYTIHKCIKFINVQFEICEDATLLPKLAVLCAHTSDLHSTFCIHHSMNMTSEREKRVKVSEIKMYNCFKFKLMKQMNEMLWIANSCARWLCVANQHYHSSGRKITINMRFCRSRAHSMQAFCVFKHLTCSPPTQHSDK